MHLESGASIGMGMIDVTAWEDYEIPLITNANWVSRIFVSRSMGHLNPHSCSMSHKTDVTPYQNA